MIKLLVLADATSLHTIRWVRGLCATNQFEVYVVSMNPGDVDTAHFAHPNFRGVERVAPRSISSSGGNYAYLLGLPALRRIVRRLNPDVISTLYLTSYGLVGALLKGRARLAHFCLGTDVMVSSTTNRVYERLARWSLGRANHVFSSSRAMTDKLISRLNVPAERISIHQYGVDEEVLVRPRPASDFDVASNRAWVPNSNLTYLLEVLAPYPRLKLVVIGGGSAAQSDLGRRIEAACAARPVCTRFATLPFEANLDVVSRSRFLASITSSDGASVSLREAMAVGTGPIVSDIPANREWVVDGENGFLLPLNDVTAAREVIARAMDLPEDRWSEMGRRGRDIIRARGVMRVNMRRSADCLADLVR